MKVKPCAHEGCKTFTVNLYCHAHKPRDIWHPYRHALDELQAAERVKVRDSEEVKR